ncbi:eukaryotic translation initiation factor 3subunit B [Striga asiatica]|uniref:Eukaryotic translation initiation factor 3subunit B n=1 Tax=Striga asiatica TaxID=4170 RepID=A0A5A7QIJ0_STRAF|nr:eukaryotic translation initiation factor 3subunit B [Striga asiatica]
MASMIHEHRSRDVPPAGRLVVVHVDALQLQVRRGVAAELAGGVDAVLAADHLPELGADLIPALASLDVENFPHFRSSFFLIFPSLRDLCVFYGETVRGFVIVRNVRGRGEGRQGVNY